MVRSFFLFFSILYTIYWTRRNGSIFTQTAIMVMKHMAINIEYCVETGSEDIAEPQWNKSPTTTLAIIRLFPEILVKMGAAIILIFSYARW